MFLASKTHVLHEMEFIENLELTADDIIFELSLHTFFVLCRRIVEPTILVDFYRKSYLSCHCIRFGMGPEDPTFCWKLTTSVKV